MHFISYRGKFSYIKTIFPTSSYFANEKLQDQSSSCFTVKSLVAVMFLTYPVHSAFHL